MKKTFVIILTMLLLAGIVSLYAAGLDEGEKRLCHVYGIARWSMMTYPPSYPPAHLILQFYWDEEEGDKYEYWTTTSDGTFDFYGNYTAAYTSATLTCIIGEGTPVEQVQEVEYDIPDNPAIPFIIYEEFLFNPIPYPK
jgi:hypothetical protein